jgi:hypothetical protein
MQMSKKLGNYEIPFDDEGNQLTYEWWYTKAKTPNFIFEDTLEYKSYSKGRSAVEFKFERESSGKSVSFSISQAEALFPLMVKGKVSGRFSFVKRGQNYSCMYLGPIEAAKTFAELVAANIDRN